MTPCGVSRLSLGVAYAVFMMGVEMGSRVIKLVATRFVSV